MAKRAYPLSKVYGLLEPGPVLLLTTAAPGRGGRPGAANVMTLSWHVMLEFEPPLVGVVLSPNDHSFAALRKTRECVLNIPEADLADAVVGCGNVSGREVDKFARLRLATRPARQVAPPLLADCPASLECRVVDTRGVARYGLFVLEVVAAWVDRSRLPLRTLHHRGWGDFMVAGETIRLPSHMR